VRFNKFLTGYMYTHTIPSSVRSLMFSFDS
jgi:hypothetical protein